MIGVERVVALLESLARGQRAQSIGELSEALSLPKSSVHRVLQSLLQCGYVQQEENRRYGVGPALARLSAQIIAGIGELRVIRPFLERLNQDTGMVTFATVWRDGRALCVDCVEGNLGALSLAVKVGGQLPIHSSAAAKVLLAHLPQEEAARIIRAQLPFKAYTSRTVVDPQELTADLARIRDAGYATCLDELDPGMMGLSAPVRNAFDRVVASITVLGPLPADPGRTAAYVHAVTSCADGASVALGASVRGAGEQPWPA